VPSLLHSQSARIGKRNSLVRVPPVGRISGVDGKKSFNAFASRPRLFQPPSMKSLRFANGALLALMALHPK
jgi:hypothetical protein